VLDTSQVKDSKLFKASDAKINQSSIKKTELSAIETTLKIKFIIDEKDFRDYLKILKQTCSRIV